MGKFYDNNSLIEAKEYWISQLSRDFNSTGVLYDFPNTNKREEKLCCISLGSIQCQKLLKICRNDDISIFVFMLAVFEVLLHKVTGENNLCIAIPLLESQNLDYENCIVISTSINGEDSFRGLLAQVKEQVLEGYKHYMYPIRKIINQLDLHKNTGIFKYFFMLDSINEKSQIKSFCDEYGNEMIFLLKKHNDELSMEIDYNACLFEDNTIVSLLNRFSLLFSQIIENSTKKIKEYKIITMYEEEKILEEYNNTEISYPRDMTIHEIFKEVTGGFFQKEAIRYNNEVLTYGQLDYISDQLASGLIQIGVAAGSIIGIMAHSSPEMIVGLLAIIKIGCAYLPLDPNYPINRTRYMLEDSQVELILSIEDYFGKIREMGFKGDLIDLRNVTSNNVENFKASLGKEKANSLAYILYTSGSTGNPKGVMIEHRGVVSLVKGMNFIEVEPSDHLLMTGSFVFDITTFEVWVSLLNGLTLHIIDDKILLDPFQLGDYINKNNITILHLIPQLFNQVASCNDSAFKNLRYFLVGGDLVRPRYLNNIRKKYESLKILHMYGPTENTTFSSWMPVEKTYEYTIPIGRPINNSSIYIMNNYGELQPIGIPGEIFVGGTGIARGYLNKPELTEERFINNPYRTGEKMYRTGDMGRWLPDGSIEFLGRNDQQVKIRGSRLEISEIEARLSGYNGINEAIIVVREATEDEKIITAYIVSESRIDLTNLRNYLSAELPEYMIPSLFIQIPDIPLTPNGKVDYKRLAEVELNFEEEYIAPRDEVEKRIAYLWSQILSIEESRISVESDFFKLGGHSLKVTVLVSKLYKEFSIRVPVDEVFKSSTVRQLAEYIRNGSKELYLDIPKAQEKELYCLSSAQKRLYILHQMNPDSISYNMTEAYVIEGSIDKDRLNTTFSSLITRHESLRTAFELKENDIFQKIYQDVDFKFEELKATEDNIQKVIEKFARPFELSKPCLFRVGLISLQENKHILVVDMHHIISDGFSSGILVNDIFKIYSKDKLPVFSKSYKDYAQWQLEQKNSGVFVKQKQYWIDEFIYDIPALNLNTDYVRTDIQSYEGDRIGFTIEKETVKQLNELAQKENCTIFMLLISISFILFNKLSDQEDIVIGTVTSGRTHPDIHDMVGMFANTLPIRGRLTKGQTFVEYLFHIRDKVLRAFENQDYQFEDIIDDLNIQRNTNRNPLFDVAFIMQNVEASDLKIPGASLTKYKYDRKTSKFDLTLFATEKSGILELEFEYCSKLFKKSTIDRYISYFKSIIIAVIRNPYACIKDIKIVSSEHKKRFIRDYNNTASEFSSEKTIQELFDKCVQDVPDGIAIIHGSDRITYHELKQRSDSLARRLIKLGVNRGEIVGLMMNNSPWLIIGILGILKSGAAYLPIDPDFPHERKKFMIEDCGCKMLLTESSIQTDELREICTVDVDKLDLSSNKEVYIEQKSGPEDVIYIIYTSGSTGKPKGCIIKQKGVVNYIEWAIKHYFEKQPVYFPLYSSVAYDMTVTSIFTPLLSGNTIIIYPKEINVLNDVINDELSNVIKATPTHLRLFLDMDCSKSAIEKIIVGGEQLTKELAYKVYEKFGGKVSIYNEYGPTETVVGCMIHEFNPYKGDRSSVPIGIPAQNMKIYILDEEMEICPVGVTGEIYIGGIGVSPGYIRRPELTQNRFVDNPFDNESLTRLYKTGDLGIYLEDGIIEYVGRIDSQIKIRGFRVEIEEIEKNLLNYPGIKTAVVVAKEGHNEDKYLCAYYNSEHDMEISDIKNYLVRNLPDYMVPAFYVKVNSIPLTPNGKADIRALPEPDTAIKSVAVLPENEVEAYLYDVWSQNLNVSGFSLEDNFFDIGGNSFILVKIHSQLSSRYPDIKVTDFFKYTTIKALSEYLLELEVESEALKLDLSMAFHEDFFRDTPNSEKETGFVFRLQESEAQEVRNLAYKHRVNEWDILLSLFALVVSDFSKNPCVKIQTLADKYGDKALSLEIDINEVQGIEKLFNIVNNALEIQEGSKLYKVANLSRLKFIKHPKSIIPFIYKSGVVSKDNLMNVYNVLVEVSEEAGNGLLFNCFYNDPLLRADKMEEFFKLYAGLLGNCNLDV